MTKKVALLVGVSEYADLPPLPAAPNDVEAMKRVLQDPKLGGFDQVKQLINPDSVTMQVAIAEIFAERKKTDLLLLFFAGHGITDDNGKLYLATHITTRNAFRATAVPATFIHDVMSESPSKRQVVILDCCYSGAFAEGWRSRNVGAVDIRKQLGGEGRAVLTSSTATQISYEQEGAGIYTRYLVEGIETGAADRDRDGMISIDELHEYAREKVQEVKPAMKPELCLVDKEGYKILLAKVPVQAIQLLKDELTTSKTLFEAEREAEEWLASHKENLVKALVEEVFNTYHPLKNLGRKTDLLAEREQFEKSLNHCLQWVIFSLKAGEPIKLIKEKMTPPIKSIGSYEMAFTLIKEKMPQHLSRQATEVLHDLIDRLIAGYL
jgi:uncharacterized caspase-like protein